MKEEIFGPVLPVIKFDSNDEACDFVNYASEKPLSMYLYSKDKSNIEKMIACTQSGGLVINEVLIQFMDLNIPFGGMNHSGIGNSHGYFGFRAFSHERPVMRSLGIDVHRLLAPPFTKSVKQRIKLIMKYL